MYVSNPLLLKGCWKNFLGRKLQSLRVVLGIVRPLGRDPHHMGVYQGQNGLGMYYTLCFEFMFIICIKFKK